MTTDLEHAIARAGEARDAIAGVIEQVRSSGDLAAAFAVGDSDALVGRCFAVKVFEVVPEIGKIRARRTMDELGLAEDVWLRDVPPAQRDQIIAAFATNP